MNQKEVDLSKIANNKIVQFIFNILFGISTAVLTLLLIEQKNAEDYYYVLIPLFSFAIIEFIVFRFQFLKKVFHDFKVSLLAVSIILALVTIYTICSEGEYTVFIKELNMGAVLAIPATVVFLYCFYDKFIFYLKKYLKSLDKIEKNYLIISSMILIISIVCVYNLTTVFYDIRTDEKDFKYTITDEKFYLDKKDLALKIIKEIYDTMFYDTIYTSDTGPLIRSQDVYMNVAKTDNSLKQPLFGVFSIPFAVVPKLASYLLPNVSNIYPILLSITHGILTLISFTLLSRLMKLKGVTKSIFLVMISITYPTLLFLLNIEQYLVPMFYLICFIYFSFKKIEDKDITYIMATGGILTSGILFPLLGEEKSWKQSIKNIFYTFLKCMAILIISARITLFFPNQLMDQMKGIHQFATSDNYTIMDRTKMYTNFLKNVLCFSEFEVKERYAGKVLTCSDKEYINEITFSVLSHCIQQMDTKKINVLGIMIGILAILGFALNRRDKFSQISFAWCMFSFILLVALGWGADENGMILYTFYFGWAFLCLIFKLIEKLLGKYHKLKYTIYTLGIASLLTINLYGIYQVILFGIQYFKY